MGVDFFLVAPGFEGVDVAFGGDDAEEVGLFFGALVLDAGDPLGVGAVLDLELFFALDGDGAVCAAGCDGAAGRGAVAVNLVVAGSCAARVTWRGEH